MKLLIVDDSVLMQERLRTAIIRRDKNVEIQQVYNYSEALQLFPSFKPDTAILDIQLPDGNGMNLIEEFRAQSPGLSILMMTNFSDKQIIRSCYEKGADKFFNKMELMKMLTYLFETQINKTE